MKKGLSVAGGLILVAAVCMAGVRTDRIVFGDATEQATAATGESATNTTTVEFQQAVAFGGNVTPSADSSYYLGDMSGNAWAFVVSDYVRCDRIDSRNASHIDLLVDLYPFSDSSYDLGGSNDAWDDVFADSLHLNPGGEASQYVIVNMDNAAGTDCTMVEWAISGGVDTDGNWRMGVVSSNFVIQVRVSGAWTNATQFTRP